LNISNVLQDLRTSAEEEPVQRRSPIDHETYQTIWQKYFRPDIEDRPLIDPKI